MSRGELTVLTYHAIDERDSVISVTPRCFRHQMDLLAATGVAGIDLAQAFRHLADTGTFPPSAVVLTFDDGYRSVLNQAHPAMARHGFTATVFLISGLVGLTGSAVHERNVDLDRDMLSWKQARDLQQAGWEIGSHTMSHPDLNRLDRNDRERELLSSRNEIEQRLQVPVRSLAYPYGRLNHTVREAAAKHYELACTTRLARQPADGDPLRIDRIDMHYMRDPIRFRKLLDGGLTGWLRLRRTLRAVRSAAHHAR